MPTRPGRAIPLVAVNVRINPEVKVDLDRYCQLMGVSMREAIEEAVGSLIKGMQDSGTSGEAVSQPKSKPAEGLVFSNMFRQGPNFRGDHPEGSFIGQAVEDVDPLGGKA